MPTASEAYAQNAAAKAAQNAGALGGWTGAATNAGEWYKSRVEWAHESLEDAADWAGDQVEGAGAAVGDLSRRAVDAIDDRAEQYIDKGAEVGRQLGYAALGLAAVTFLGLAAVRRV